MADETVESLKAELEELKQSFKAVANKKDELLDELKKAKRKNEEAPDVKAFYDLQDKYDKLKDEKTKLELDYKKTAKTVEKLTEDNQKLSNDFTSLVVDDGLTNELTKAGVKPEFLDATKALLRSKVELKENTAVVGDKQLSEFMQEWVITDGKAFVADNNSGGGAGGGAGGENKPKPGTREADLARAKELLEGNK